MASSLDFEKLWNDYQNIVKTKNVSIVDYCQRNGIVYSQFERWYKKFISNVRVLPVTGELSENHQQQTTATVAGKMPTSQKTPTVEYVSIAFTNGLKVCQKSLDYSQLRLLVEKLEALC
jgi:hypothetical protein